MLSRSDIIKKMYQMVTGTLTALFQVALISYLFFYSIERIKPGFVSDYFELNMLLILTFVSGALTVMLKGIDQNHEEQKPVNAPGLRQYVFIIFLGLVVAFIMYERTKQVGWLSYVISGMSGLVLIVLSISLWWDDTHSQENH